MVAYPKDYPEANKLPSASDKAQSDFGSLGALPAGAVKPDGGIKEMFFDHVGHKEVAETKARNKPLKKGDAKTVGSQEFDKGMDPVKFIKKFDPKNSSGSIPFALNLVNQIKNNSGPDKMLTDIVGSQLGGMIGQFTQLIQGGLVDQAMAIAKKIQEGVDSKENDEEKNRANTAANVVANVIANTVTSVV